MDDKFDQFLKKEIGSAGNQPIPPGLWDKNKTWEKISAGLDRHPKTVSVYWLYAAASLIFVIIISSAFFYQSSSRRVRQLEIENARLSCMEKVPGTPGKNEGSSTEKTVTIFQTKELVKREIVRDTVIVHDTIRVLIPFQEAEKEPIAANIITGAADTSEISEQEPKVKTGNIQYAIAADTGEERTGKKMRIGTKRYSKDDNEYVRPELTIKKLVQIISDKNIQ
jgi:hypothetical protein